MLPVHPEGRITDTTIKAVMHFQYETISRGRYSLLRQLVARYPDVDISEYVSFFSLRTHDYVNGERLVTNMVYVHSKLLIVDDNVLIMGSANINDRSMLGNRDSELCIGIYEAKPDVSFNSNDTSSVIKRFREKLWAAHLHLSPDFLAQHDPTSDLIYRQAWVLNATRNTLTYQTAFPFLPHDSLTSYAAISKARKQKRPHSQTSRVALAQVHGLVVQHPIDFLKEEYLMPSVVEVEAVLANSMWV
jgi:phospholipase D1/2